jgi:hypothetical protein
MVVRAACMLARQDTVAACSHLQLVRYCPYGQYADEHCLKFVKQRYHPRFENRRHRTCVFDLQRFE